LDVENGGSRLLRNVKYLPVDMALCLRRHETTMRHQFCIWKGHSPHEGKLKSYFRWECLFSTSSERYLWIVEFAEPIL
jgi:hypothetical protein